MWHLLSGVTAPYRPRRTIQVSRLAAIQVGVLSLLLGSCSFGSSSHPMPLPSAQQVAHIGLDADPYSNDLRSLDPVHANNYNGDGSGFISSLIFPPLLTVDDHLNPEPWAATGMPTFDARTNTYSFNIRLGLKWSDGTPIDANTYAYSLNRDISPCGGSPNTYYLFAIRDAGAFSSEICLPNGKSIQGKIQTLLGDSLLVPDNQTLVIKLAAPAPYLLEALTTPLGEAQPEQFITRYGSFGWTQHLTDDGGLGGNLYRVKSWDQKAGHLDLVSCLSSCGAGHATGWGGHAAGSTPYLRGLDFSFYLTTGYEQVDYQAGNLDIASFPSASYRDSQKGSVFEEIQTLEMTYLQVSWAKPPFDDLRVRQAFALALNKVTLARQLGLIASNHIVPAGMSGYDPTLLGPDETTSATGDVRLARALLQSYADDRCGGRFSTCPPVVMPYGPCISGTLPADPTLTAVTMWKQAFPGYPIKSSSIDFCGLISVIPSPNVPQVFATAWIADYADPQDWLSLQFAPGAINNFSTVDVPAADALMSKADSELDSNQRIALYNQAEQLLVMNVAWIPIGQSLAFYDLRSWVSGFGLTALGYPTLDQVYRIEMVKLRGS
jgi:oligopeptide transport system substrate-binding protein